MMRLVIFSLLSASIFVLFPMEYLLAGRANVAASTVSITVSPEGVEGDVGPTTFTFTLRRTGDLTTPCIVTFETREGTAFAPEDFTHAGGTLAFAPGQSTVLMPVAVTGDIFAELDETFFLDLTASTGDCSLSVSQGMAVIVDTDGPAPPGSCLNGIEGDVGQADAAVRVNDLVKLRRYVLGLDTIISGCELQKADINGDCGDGRVDAADVAVIRQWLLAGGGQRPNCGPTEPAH